MRFLNPSHIQQTIAEAMKARRLALGYTQQEAAQKAGVSLSCMHRLESSGEIALKNLLRVVFAYRMEESVIHAFTDRSWWGLEEALVVQTRKRVKHGSQKT